MILGLVEHDRGKLAELSLEMVTFERRLAERLGTSLGAILIGGEARPLAGQLGAYGVSSVHVAEHEGLDAYAPGAWAACVVELMRSLEPPVLMAAGSDRGTEVMAHVAARTELPLAANCTEVRPGNPFGVTRLRWGGSLLEEASLEGSMKLLTVAPHAVLAEEAPGPVEPSVASFIPAISADDLRVRVNGRVPPMAGRVSLAEARVVIGGGRGVGSPEGFRPLEELAELLGGAVGCSRAVTSAGWRPHAEQIGQTGTRIAPDLYMACGISGATQHVVGCRGAKHILAINTDREAPILALADYAVFGDVRQIVPALCSEIKRAKSGG